jgi:two-component system nitrate/nitrite response regulator NarL
VSIVIADQQSLVLYGLLAVLRPENGFNVVASCRDGESCIQSIQALTPELALIDLSLPPGDVFQVLAAVRAGQLSTRVVCLSASPAPSQEAKAIASGAYGILRKDVTAQKLLESLRQVTYGQRLPSIARCEPADGNEPRTRREDWAGILTEREREITRLVCAGLSNKEIGRELRLSYGTIKVHLHNIYRKLAIQNRTALAALGTRDAQENARPQRKSTHRKTRLRLGLRNF